MREAGGPGPPPRGTGSEREGQEGSSVPGPNVFARRERVAQAPKEGPVFFRWQECPVFFKREGRGREAGGRPLGGAPLPPAARRNETH